MKTPNEGSVVLVLLMNNEVGVNFQPQLLILGIFWNIKKNTEQRHTAFLFHHYIQAIGSACIKKREAQRCARPRLEIDSEKGEKSTD